MNIQVGLYSDANSKITLSSTLFASSSSKSLFGGSDEIAAIAKKCSGQQSGVTAASMLTTIDNALKTINDRNTKIGAAQNRIDSAIESIAVQSENITSSLSTLRDADIASESSSYIRSQILQQAASTLLATANQSPSIALNLI